MILILLILVPLVGGAAAWIWGHAHPALPRWAALVTTAIELLLSLGLWVRSLTGVHVPPWYFELRAPWIPALGISFHLALDGLSLVLVTLTAFLGLVAVAVAWNEIRDRTGFFYMNLMWLLAGITGVFLALDLFLFLFFWELMLVPTYLLYFWGAPDQESSARRMRAGLRFFVYTQVSGLLMLIAAVGLAIAHQQATGTLTFDYQELIATPLGGTLGMLLMLGFFFAFAVKLPLFPFHTWQPDAYVEAPTAVTVVLAGAMAKTAGYGLIRFLVPLFPAAAAAVRALRARARGYRRPLRRGPRLLAARPQAAHRLQLDQPHEPGRRRGVRLERGGAPRGDDAARRARHRDWRALRARRHARGADRHAGYRTASEGCGRGSQRSARASCCSRSPRSACPGSATSSRSSYFSRARSRVAPPPRASPRSA